MSDDKNIKKLMEMFDPEELKARIYFGLEDFEKSVGGVEWDKIKTPDQVVLKGQFNFKGKDFKIEIVVRKDGTETPKAEIKTKAILAFAEIIGDKKSLKYWVENR